MELEATSLRPAHKHDGELEPDSIIADRYRIVARIAEGGMGEVYKVEHIALGRALAMKVMKRELSQDGEFVSRFKREATAASKIGHQNIVDVTDFGRTPNGRFYFVMEHLDGETLTQRLRRSGALKVSEVLHIGAQICRALSAAHHLGIVHRDLKPENVMVLKRSGEPDHVKVVDFGVAKVSQAFGQGGQTAIGMVMGTPQYMSPEQAAGLAVDHRSDIYSLGLMLYELLAGRPVFQGETPSLLMALQMTEPPPPLVLPDGAGDMHPQLEAVLFQMLAKRPEQRPASLDEVLQVIEALRPKTGYTPSATRLAPALKPGSGTFKPPPTIPPSITADLPAQVRTPTPPRAQTPARPQTPPRAQPASTPSRSRRAADTKPRVEPAPQRKSLLPTVAGAALSIAIGAVAAFGAMSVFGDNGAADPQPIVILAPPTAPPPPQAPVAVDRVTVTLETAPAGAEVYDGEVLVGTTPATLTRNKGDVVELKFVHRGYRAETRKVSMDEERIVKIALAETGAAQAPAAAEPPATPAPAVKKAPAKKSGADLKPAPW